MINFDELYKELVADEGRSLDVYKDHLGHLTVGVGHLISIEEGLSEGDVITDHECDALLHFDAKSALSDCVSLYPGWLSLPDDVQLVLVNMSFNLGRTKLSKFVNFKKAIDRMDFMKAACEMEDSLWYRQVNARARRLVGRMIRAADMSLDSV